MVNLVAPHFVQKLQCKGLSLIVNTHSINNTKASRNELHSYSCGEKLYFFSYMGSIQPMKYIYNTTKKKEEKKGGKSLQQPI